MRTKIVSAAVIVKQKSIVINQNSEIKLKNLVSDNYYK